MSAPTLTPKVLADGLAYVESPRWHDGRLWLAHWGMGEIIAVAMDGTTEVITKDAPPALGWSIDWLPDDRLLMTGKELRRMEPDGTFVRHADLTSITPFGWNELTVDGRGNIYVNSINFEFLKGEKPGPTGIIALVRPDGSIAKVADGIEFPNGMVVTPDNKTLILSESMAGRLVAFDIAGDGTLSNKRAWVDKKLGPDGICLDESGAVWVQTADTFAHSQKPGAPEGAVIRLSAKGEELARVEHDRAIFAAMLGGPDRKTLFLMAADWQGTEKIQDAVKARKGQVLTVEAPAAGVGWP